MTLPQPPQIPPYRIERVIGGTRIGDQLIGGTVVQSWPAWDLDDAEAYCTAERASRRAAITGREDYRTVPTFTALEASA